MPDTESTSPQIQDFAQLAQVRVPMDQAAEAFAERDAGGRTPIVVVPTHPSRIRTEFVAAGGLAIVGGVVGWLLLNNLMLVVVGLALGLLLIVLGVHRSFRVLIPEGACGLLARRGLYLRTIGAGLHVIPPWIAVTHLVTRREIPFEVPVIDAPTQDNVRASLDALTTFTITDPYRFVYSISASDFDQVLQADSQHALRAMIRRISWGQLNDLAGSQTDELRAALNTGAEAYGVTISKVNIIGARPPATFFASEEARQLAILQRAEETEQQALAQHRQANAEGLARQAVLARVERERDEARIDLEQAEARRRIADVELTALIDRLARLEEALGQYPVAAEWEWQGAQLEVARALASNSRAMLQVGNAGDIARALMMGDLRRPDGSSAAAVDPGAGPPKIEDRDRGEQETDAPEAQPVEPGESLGLVDARPRT
jgi:regulator of protease activity HflC (stomatin/prohibitin superfamily)